MIYQKKKTKHRGIYKVDDTYYITYYVGSKKYEKTVKSKLSVALKEKMERERRGDVAIMRPLRGKRKPASNS